VRKTQEGRGGRIVLPFSNFSKYSSTGQSLIAVLKIKHKDNKRERERERERERGSRHKVIILVPFRIQ